MVDGKDQVVHVDDDRDDKKKRSWGQDSRLAGSQAPVESAAVETVELKPAEVTTGADYRGNGKSEGTVTI